MKKEDLAYTAGLFDGEGHCRIGRYQASKNGKYYNREIATITNTDRRALDFVRKLFSLGFIEKARKRQKRKRVFRLVMTHKSAREFLIQIRPYVKIKGEQIDKVLK